MEEQLLRTYIEARERKESLSKEAKLAGEKLDQAIDALVKFLQDTGKKSTGKYEGLGNVTLGDPIIRPNVHKGDETRLHEYVTNLGRGDLIKASIHHSTLGSFIAEMLTKGEELPDFIGYYLQPVLKLTKG